MFRSTECKICLFIAFYKLLESQLIVVFCKQVKQKGNINTLFVNSQNSVGEDSHIVKYSRFGIIGWGVGLVTPIVCYVMPWFLV